jgi:UDP-2-acetamido-2-deoxy-ribo-hexuluronate aminotransferase
MDTMQCAILLAKLERFDWEVERRIEIGSRYNALIDQQQVLRIQQRSNRTSVFAQYTIFAEEREVLQKKLMELGVPTAVHYPVPLNQQPAYRFVHKRKKTPIAQKLAGRVMSLPMHPYLSSDQQRDIVRSLI